MGKNSPTQRSLKMLREQGYECEIVERWNAFAKVRKDLYGFIDILCMCPHRGFLAVQTTTASHAEARLQKIDQEPRALQFLAAGGHIHIHGWKKLGVRNSKALGLKPGTWHCSIIQYGE